MPTIINYIAFLLSISAILSVQTGIKTGIDQPTVLQGIKHFIPQLLKKLVDIKVPRKVISIDTGFGDLIVDTNNILLTVTDIPKDKLDLLFNTPDIVNLISKDIKAKGSMNINLKMGFFTDNLPTNLSITTLNINSDLQLQMEKSKVLPDRNIPAIDCKNIAVEFDFDFKVDSKIIGSLLQIESVKRDIKAYIQREAQDVIKNKLKDVIKTSFSEFMNKEPLQPKIYKDVSLDFSIVEKPYIEKKLLILNFRGQILNNEVIETLTPPFDLVEITTPLGDTNKGIDNLITNYMLNTGLYTLILSKLFKIEIKDKDLPPEAPFRLDTTTLNRVLPGLVDKYGKDKPVNLNLEGILPVNSVGLKDGKIFLDEFATCAVVVEGFEKAAVIFKIQYEASISVRVDSNSIMTLKIIKIDLKDLSILETELPNIKVGFTMFLINNALRMSIPAINQKLKPFEVNIPEKFGMKFNNPELNIKLDYIELGLNAEFKDSEEIENKSEVKQVLKYLK